MDDDAGEILQHPGEDRFPGERELVGRAEVEMELEMIHESILVQPGRAQVDRDRPVGGTPPVCGAIVPAFRGDMFRLMK
ncbi:hypothetical protein GCM10009690_23430 [Brevibacterium permense]|uniref:Uncharacterized protein n=1 Tax=Brevibacterium permense TaxID=234834 RepID=A0ABP4LA79_9MICO